MAADNVEIFKRLAHAISWGDEQSVVELTTDDVEVSARRSATEGIYRGHDGLRAYLADNRESFEFFRYTLDEVRDLGDGRVVGVGTIRIRGKGSGAETDVPSAGIATFRNGKATSWKEYGDRETASKAAGLD